MSDVVSRVVDASQGVGVCDAGSVQPRYSGTYYAAYIEYMYLMERTIAGGRDGVDRVGRVGEFVRSFAPPVWCGCGGVRGGGLPGVEKVGLRGADGKLVCEGDSTCHQGDKFEGSLGCDEASGGLGNQRYSSCELESDDESSQGHGGSTGGGCGIADGETVVRGDAGDRGNGLFRGGEQSDAKLDNVRDVGATSGELGRVGVDRGSSVVTRGKNYEKNKMKRERAKALRASVSGLRDVCPSLTGSVRTVDTRTAEEIEAVRTLASRRVAENKVARKMAELKLVSLGNKDKTDALLRLEAARMEQRINEARAKSQASFKKCDTSLKSLGSTGSAGEFALKQEVKRGKDWEIKCKYAQLQNDYMIKHVPEHVRQVILDMPEPVLEHDAEVFGECPEDYDDEQRMAYDIEMNSRAAGVQY